MPLTSRLLTTTSIHSNVSRATVRRERPTSQGHQITQGTMTSMNVLMRKHNPISQSISSVRRKSQSLHRTIPNHSPRRLTTVTKEIRIPRSKVALLRLANTANRVMIMNDAKNHRKAMLRAGRPQSKFKITPHPRQMNHFVNFSRILIPVKPTISPRVPRPNKTLLSSRILIGSGRILSRNILTIKRRIAPDNTITSLNRQRPSRPRVRYVNIHTRRPVTVVILSNMLIVSLPQSRSIRTGFKVINVNSRMLHQSHTIRRSRRRPITS